MNFCVKKLLLLSSILCVFFSCSEEQIPVVEQTMGFQEKMTEQTGVDFVNQLRFDKDFNVYKYRNFYNGGGVALGDINNDGLIDLYFTANMEKNRLYINKGDFVFEDVTEKAGVGGDKAWSTGVSMADVNADGWLDIYVCNSGDVQGDNKQNEFYINNGDGTFSEKAADFGIADKGFSTHGVFFDYDLDGDLDLYLLNNSYRAITSFNLQKNERTVRDEVGGDKLYRNDGDGFTDVSEAAGIYGSIIGFGLGVTVGDVNNDGWMDIYVSNDFFERDYLYINQQNGTFTEELTEQMQSISGASMGADMADINNDGYPDVFVTEMLPEPNDRYKTKTTFESWDRYQFVLSNGYHHQFTRNMLQLNNGDATFSEIGRLADVEATDWSWGALIFDMDGDGIKDLFVANGIYQDLTDQDYIQFASNEEFMKKVMTGGETDYKQLIEAIPSNKIANYAFKNNEQLDFQNKTKDWHLDKLTHSNGSAYGDLDNDGDLDLVINNVNMPCLIYENRFTNNAYLKLTLKGDKNNTSAIGSKMYAWRNGAYQYLEQMPMRGFQSTIDARPNFSFGQDATALDSLVLQWNNKEKTVLKNVELNQHLIVDKNSETVLPINYQVQKTPTVFTKNNNSQLNFTHKENQFSDFNRDRLLYFMLSTEGPKVAADDLNGDGLDDVIIGGAKGEQGALYFQKQNGTFSKSNTTIFEENKSSEDTDIAIFDADGDKDMDVYICSGGSEFSSSDFSLRDRLYLNDGKGNFTKTKQKLPTVKPESSSCVRPADFDQDGDVDLFVGIRHRPFLYGVPTNGYILVNDGKGNFTHKTNSLAPALKEIGLVTDATWADVDGDKDLDLLVVGEWMPLTLFINDNNTFTPQIIQEGASNGWWNCIKAADLDQDGDTDFVIGNHGINSRFQPSPDKPVEMYVNDFDGNGGAEQIVTAYSGEQSYPLVLRHNLIEQIPSLKKQFVAYKDYAPLTINDIFPEEILSKSVKKELHTLETVVLINNNGTFEIKPLPIQAQFSTTYGLWLEDFNKDGQLDILIGGNFDKAKPEVGRYDASYGLLLTGDGKMNFTPLSSKESGIKIKGQIRDFATVRTNDGNLLIVAKNNEAVEVLKY